MPDWSQDLYQKTLHFAAQAHQGQKFPGTELPYVIHVCSVCMEVMAALAHEAVANPNLTIQCALLHDTLEDTKTSFNILAERFGLVVAQGVQALSKDPNLPKPEQMGDSLRRIQAQPREVWMVKLADRIINLQAPPHYWSAEKIAQYQHEAEVIHQALAAASPYLAQRLEAKIVAYSSYRGSR